MEHNRALPFAPYEVAQANARMTKEPRHQAEAMERRKTPRPRRRPDEIVIPCPEMAWWRGPGGLPAVRIHTETLIRSVLFTFTGNSGGDMPRYHFNVFDGHSTPDKTGTALRNWKEARHEAVHLAGALLQEGAERICLGEDWRMEVTDDAGRVLFRIGLTMAVA